MKHRTGMSGATLLMLSLAAGTAQAQVAVAAGEIGKGVWRATEKTSTAAARAAADMAVAVPRVVTSSVVIGAATGVAITASSLAVGTAEIGAKAGASMLRPAAGAAKNVSFGVLKAGWHAAWGGGDNRRSLKGN